MPGRFQIASGGEQRLPRVSIAVAAMLVTAVQAPAAAGWFSSAPDTPATAMVEGRRHLGPKAYRVMCLREPHLCAFDESPADAAGRSAVMDEARWAAVAEINERVNAEIHPGTDLDIFGELDHWTAGVHLGDCEEYIITKKQRLIEAGFQSDQLLYAVVRGFRDPYHAVLVLRTTVGDYILDNETDRILPWEDTGYQFVIRQSAGNPGTWVHVVGRAPAQTQQRLVQLR